jgi:hypothetical protein
MGFGSVAWISDETRAREPEHSRVLPFRDSQPRLTKSPKPRADPERCEMGLTPGPCRAHPRSPIAAESKSRELGMIIRGAVEGSVRRRS